MKSRRQILWRGAAGSAAALALSPAAFAFRIVEEDTTDRARALIGACETRNAHERMVAQILAELEGQPDGGPAIDRVRDMACPFCGCGLAAALPERDPEPRF